MDNGTCPTTTWTQETEPMTTWVDAGCLGTTGTASSGSTTPVIPVNTTNIFDGLLLSCAGLL